MGRFTDANIFIRLIAWDDPEKGRACLELFRRVREGFEAIVTSEAIIAEVAYVLSSRRIYGLGRAEIVAKLVPLLQLRGVHLSGKPIVIRALERYEGSTLDFADCLVIEHAVADGLEGIYSYDQALGRGSPVPRFEPDALAIG